MTAAIVLSAGLGTRLRPLTDACAKPLVPVGDRTALAHVVARLAPAVDRVVVNAFHRKEDVRTAAEALGCVVCGEEELLGTAGGVANAAAALGDGDVLVWNGDVLADVAPRALLSAHAGDATLVVRRGDPGTGNVGVDARGDLVRLRRERIRGGEVAGGEFLGVHVLGRGLRASLPSRGCLVGDLYLPALRSGARLTTVAHGGTFHDIGTLPSYLTANVTWVERRGAPFVARSARVASGITLRRCVVGACARVEGDGLLEDVVVWPGAIARAPCTRAIVTRSETVFVPPTASASND